MICIQCGHSKTSVVNSRPHKSQPRVWRRRTCPKCHTMVTTYETIDVADQCLVDTIPFSAIRLSMNIHQYLTKRSTSPDEAYSLALTVGETLVTQKRASVTRRELIDVIWKTLSLYQPKAGMRYGIDYDCIEVKR